ncbi:MAG TPA: hypothetical protein VMZ03_06570 [Chitinophagaceae bacterium]|nr:hypothetical protein [Chitinophagaceae bacterium]
MAKAKKAKKKKAVIRKTATKKLIIEGKFTGSLNNQVILEVFRSNSLAKPYDFRKTYTANFKETFKDLEPQLEYDIDITGHTVTGFTITMSGDIQAPNPQKDTIASSSFSRGYTIKTIK